MVQFTPPGLKLIKRAASFLHRYRSFLRLGNGVFSSLKLIFDVRARRSETFSVTYHGTDLFFRVEDQQALIEVLADQEYEILRPYLLSKKRPVVLDIGCHIGTFSRWVKSVNAEAAILAIEADPRTFQIAQRNLASFVPNLTILNRAAAARDNEMLFLSDAGPSMSHRLDPNGDVSVKSISLDTIIHKAGGVVDIMKIDIEGAEEAFLENHKSLRSVNVLIIELHPQSCDSDSVRAKIAEVFDNIVNVGSRYSSKPLILCSRTQKGTTVDLSSRTPGIRQE